MADKYMMAIDEGTTSTRAVIVDHAGNMVGEAQKNLPNIFLNLVGLSMMLMKFGKPCCQRSQTPSFRPGFSLVKLPDLGSRINAKRRWSGIKDWFADLSRDCLAVTANEWHC